MDCAKYECHERAERKVTVVPGVSVCVCAEHVPWALRVAMLFSGLVSSP